jgi:uncharacterized protein YpuA (DUF1002 family)
MFKKFIASILIVAFALVAFAVPAFAAVAEGERRVTIGADLTVEEKAQIYEDFGIEEGSVKEIIVTNDEERAYLAGLVPDEKIGYVALSCIYLTTLKEGEGMNVTTHNINWCTQDMYINALVTAGIEDASVMVSAPHPVSGTAALTGVYKAYEDITGQQLDQGAKEAGAEELVVTGELAEVIGSEQATELINELKKILDQTKDMTDAELHDQIVEIANNLNIELTEDQISQIMNLVRTLEGLDISDWGDRLTQLGSAMETMNSVGDGVSGFFKSVTDFFSGIGDWFSGLFGGND